jgi:hypothetical protein
LSTCQNVNDFSSKTSRAIGGARTAVGKDVTAVYFEKEGHGYNRWQTNLRRARIVENFLAKHLGGRPGGFDYTELAAEYLN